VEPNRARGGGRRWRRFDLTRLVAPPCDMRHEYRARPSRGVPCLMVD
jgi:hypothetical protein